MAIRAAGYQGGISQFLDLSVVTLVVCLRSDEKNLVPLHHLFVCMAFLADLGVELSARLHHLGFIPFQYRNFVKAMAVGTGR
jgi:hypothetical protein